MWLAVFCGSYELQAGIVEPQDTPSVLFLGGASAVISLSSWSRIATL